MKKSIQIAIGIVLTFFYLLAQLYLMKDYGFSWDYHYHFYAGLYHLGLPVPSINDPPPVPFTPPDPRLTVEDPFGPFTQILPSLSYVLLFEKFHLLPPDSAYNFPMVVLGSLGVGLLYFFLLEAEGFITAISAAAFLALLPVHFGYLHTSMKDVPNAFAFALSLFLFWRLVQYQRIRDLVLAVIAFAFAFNVKINSVMIPVICFLYILIVRFKTLFSIVKGRLSKLYENKFYYIVLFFILSPIAAIMLWWPFWKNPLGKLIELPTFYSQNTINMPVLYFGEIIRSGINIPFLYPYTYIAITTPLPILLFFLIGIVTSFTEFRRKRMFTLLLILWFFIPLTRYMSPKIGAIDGVRHFLEIVYPMCAIAGFGFMKTGSWLYQKTKNKVLISILFITIIGILSYNIFHFHPYETSYFNSVIGGIKGANGKFDIDFWGTPQREAMYWLNQQAKQNAVVFVAMAQSSAAMYLRSDLLKWLNTKSPEESDYVVVLNRQSFFTFNNLGNFVIKKLSEKSIVFTKEIDTVPLVWVFKN